MGPKNSTAALLHSHPHVLQPHGRRGGGTLAVATGTTALLEVVGNEADDEEVGRRGDGHNRGRRRESRRYGVLPDG